MNNILIKPIETNDKDWTSSVLEKQWGSVNIVTRGKIYQSNILPGYIAFIDNKRVGLITYNIDNDCEIITIDSSIKGKGIGQH